MGTSYQTLDHKLMDILMSKEEIAKELKNYHKDRSYKNALISHKERELMVKF